MELHQLEYFVAVAEEANFTRAAERVRISQSGVSAQVRRLEHEVGAALLDRAGRTATVTAAGAAALEHARAALASVAALRHAVDEVNGLVRGRLVIGMVNGCTVTALFAALAGFHRAHPGVELALFEDASDRLIDGVRGGTVDLALVGAGGTRPAGVDGMTIVSEPIVAVVAPGHPLAARERTSLAELAGYPVITMPEGTGIRAVFDASCADAGVAPVIALQAGAPAAVADLAGRGLGVGVLSRSMTAEHTGRLRSLVIEDAVRPALLALVWKRAPSAALQRLVAIARPAFDAAGPEPG
jgi:DNA-binding transcriptional LysR family regulator